MNTDIISIPNTSDSDGVTYYNISIKLPLRSLTIQKRYSDFQELVSMLSNSLGISQNDFPYKLPPKASWFKSNESLIEERRTELTSFLNSVIKDSTLQNNSIVRKFLQLPNNFKFSSNMFRNKEMNDLNFNIDVWSIDKVNWLELFRLIKHNINELSGQYSANPSINTKISIRDKINRYIRPNLTKLSNALDDLTEELTADEVSRRILLLKESENDSANLQSLLESNGKSSSNTARENLFNNTTNPKRVLGQKPRETNETLLQDNQELFQHQIQIHKEQDQELAELRKIIARQRQIGEVINSEVEEQNNLLDLFNQEVDQTTDKVRLARKKARNIL